MLIFRYNTIEEAKRHARSSNYSGAKYPEESDNTGQETAPNTIVNYFTGEVFEEWSGKEVQHISADVAYAVHKYFEITGDYEFFTNYGMEILVETARFGASLVDWDSKKKRFVILNVMGPDEYHYHVDNNFYTNYMVKWNLKYTAQAIRYARSVFPKAAHKVERITGLTDSELKRWEYIADRMYLPRKINDNLFEQFEGYFDLPDQTVTRYAANKRPTLNKKDLKRSESLMNFSTRLIKQADVILLFFLFGEDFSMKEKVQNFKYYEKRTIHESSLSDSPHALIACEIGDVEKAYKYFMKSCRYNLDYSPKKDYRNGIHLASYAGAYRVIINGFAGIKIDNNNIYVAPKLPKHWGGMEFNIFCRNNLIHFEIKDKCIAAELIKKSDENKVNMVINNKTVALKYKSRVRHEREE